MHENAHFLMFTVSSATPATKNASVGRIRANVALFLVTTGGVKSTVAFLDIEALQNVP